MMPVVLLLLLVMSVVSRSAQTTDSRMSTGHGARHADEVACGWARGVVGESLEGHGVVEGEGVGGHGGAAAGGVENVGVGGAGASEGGCVGAVCRRALCGAVGWGEDSSTGLYGCMHALAKVHIFSEKGKCAR